jgi:pyridoxal phosphate enzyme (YggS family)
MEDLSQRLAGVRARIARAAEGAGRSEPELIVVTKNFPSSDAMALADLGVRLMGENRDQEARPKSEELRARGGEQPAWHFIGQLQTNKAKSVVTYAHAVHSVDRIGLVTALDKAMHRAREQRAGAGLPEALDCFIQVSLDSTEGLAEGATGLRGGARPEDVLSVAAAIQASETLTLAGVMAVAPLGEDPAEAFGRLAEIHGKLVTAYPGAVLISAGMSQDLEAAVVHGATHVRVGSDVLGPRTYVG